ncbi:kinesin family member 22 [Pancytospora philotis]|nr:kinesin family member 22 [Pancytospora philotis]
MKDTAQPSQDAIPLKVMVRIKPSDADVEHTPTSITVLNSKGAPVSYSFDRCFGADAKTPDIYEIIRPAIAHKGDAEPHSHVSIIAYGQTGSGKTHTMSGSPGAPGIVPMVLKDLLGTGPASVSFIEIYNEKIIDLLDGREKAIRGGDDGLVVCNLTAQSIARMQDFESVFATALASRKTGETRLNSQSSRSHLIIRVETAAHTIDLVDLAGSENNRKTGNAGLRMEESLSINRSLFVFSSVVNAIVNREKRVPYRDSKLTRLLQNSVGGTGHCFLIATVLDCAEDNSEMINTLNFASKSRSICNAQSAARHAQKAGDSLFDRLHSGGAAKHTHVEKPRPAFESRHAKSQKCNAADLAGGTNTQRSPGTAVRTDDTDQTNACSAQRTPKGVAPQPLAKGAANKENVAQFNTVAACGTSPKCEADPKKHKGCASSSFSSTGIEMTPVTKQKSYDFFLGKANDFEANQDLKGALEMYRTVRRFVDTEFVAAKIAALQSALKKERAKFSAFRVLEILNSGVFIEIKRLSGIGDRRAQSIVDFIAGGNFFESLSDLRLIFSEKVVGSIMECVEDGSALK